MENPSVSSPHLIEIPAGSYWRFKAPILSGHWDPHMLRMLAEEHGAPKLPPASEYGNDLNDCRDAPMRCKYCFNSSGRQVLNRRSHPLYTAFQFTLRSPSGLKAIPYRAAFKNTEKRSAGREMHSFVAVLDRNQPACALLLALRFLPFSHYFWELF